MEKGRKCERVLVIIYKKKQNLRRKERKRNQGKNTSQLTHTHTHTYTQIIRIKNTICNQIDKNERGKTAQKWEIVTLSRKRIWMAQITLIRTTLRRSMQLAAAALVKYGA